MSDAKLSSAKQRWLLLGSILKDPKLLNNQISKACKSQGAIARFQLEEREIYPVSLNTLKTNAKLNIETQNGLDGWQQLEERRRRVNLIVTERAAVRSKQAKCTDAARLAELRDTLNKSNRERLRIIKGYFELLGIARELAKKDEALTSRLNRHLQDYSLKKLLLIDGGKNEN